MSSAKPKAEAGVTAFHEELNAAKFDSIWNEADASYRKAATRENYDKLMTVVHRRLGRALKSTNVNWVVRNFNLQTTIVLAEHTEFEHGSGNETFTYVVRGDDVKLAGYNIQSIDLLAL